jgi:rubredoxin
MKYVCQVCGYVHDEEVEGVLFSELPKKKDYIPEEYTFPVKTEEELIAEGQAKIITMNI